MYKEYKKFSTQCIYKLNFCVIGQLELMEEVSNSSTTVRIGK
jgi:hypothetical protein